MRHPDLSPQSADERESVAAARHAADYCGLSLEATISQQIPVLLVYMSLKDKETDKSKPQNNRMQNAATASNQYSVSDFLLTKIEVPGSRSLTNVDGLQYHQKDEDEIPEKNRKGHVDPYHKPAEVSLLLSKTSDQGGKDCPDVISNCKPGFLVSLREKRSSVDRKARVSGASRRISHRSSPS
ncbi:hypothetical protein BDR22DRAFT_383093 [Usnea florida]